MSCHKDWALMTIDGIIREMSLSSTLTGKSETMTWLPAKKSLPLWSRRLPRRELPKKWHAFDVEVPEHLWTLWGGVHPRSSCFDSQVRGRQTLACCVVACCAASIYRSLKEWTPKFLDAIVISGDKYYRASMLTSRGPYDLSLECDFHGIDFLVQLQLVAYGQLYSAPAGKVMGLYEALNYFFTRYQHGLVKCLGQHFAFGYSSCRDGGYFLYDCSAWDKPLFPDNMGASYVLRSKQLLLLAYCMVITLNIRQLGIDFQIFSVQANRAMN
ncbi:uncharacterized protein LOC108650217 [Drosophila navojoa]|nr:uncharacterized protein LOC108650217 [Drosophila navojoa]